MPAINSGTVLVTGASGFLGTYVVEELLKRGFKVRAVVRDDKKGEYMQKNWPGTEYVIVKDMNAVSPPTPCIQLTPARRVRPRRRGHRRDHPRRLSARRREHRPSR